VLVATVAVFNLSQAAQNDSPTTTATLPSTNLSAGLLTLNALEQSGARIGKIEVINENIFDRDNPSENRTLYRWANALHITTKPAVISTQLLFQPGDSFSEQTIKETERLLRSNRYLSDVRITPTSYNDGVVDLLVRTTDVWTLSPGISFSRGGGKNSGGIGLKEYNLLGRGSNVGISYKSTVDRDTLSLRYIDRNVFGSRYQTIAEYADASDGYSQRLGLDRPFFALNTRRAGGATIRHGRRTESLYETGDIVTQFEHAFAEHDFYLGWSKGLKEGWTKRVFSGLGFRSSEYGAVPDGLYPQAILPDDRRFVYPFVGMEFLQDDYITTKNFDQINRTEDRHLGMRASFRLGYAGRALGSYDSAWIYQAQFSNTLLRTSNSTLVVGADLAGRLENGAATNARLSVSGRYDKRQSDNRLLHISLAATTGENLDLENTTYIGGDNGLRGYPLRYQAGDSSVLFTLEQRLFTDWYPFRLFSVGGAVFFDAGKTWGSDPVVGKHYGWLKNIGVGLRIGNTRSGIGRMIHVDLAYPFDDVKDISNLQLLIEARKGF
jgi:hemolysin activation/secretion protein